MSMQVIGVMIIAASVALLLLLRPRNWREKLSASGASAVSAGAALSFVVGSALTIGALG